MYVHIYKILTMLSKLPQTAVKNYLLGSYMNFLLLILHILHYTYTCTNIHQLTCVNKLKGNIKISLLQLKLGDMYMYVYIYCLHMSYINKFCMYVLTYIQWRTKVYIRHPVLWILFIFMNLKGKVMKQYCFKFNFITKTKISFNFINFILLQNPKFLLSFNLLFFNLSQQVKDLYIYYKS